MDQTKKRKTDDPSIARNIPKINCVLKFTELTLNVVDKKIEPCEYCVHLLSNLKLVKYIKREGTIFFSISYGHREYSSRNQTIAEVDSLD